MLEAPFEPPYLDVASYYRAGDPGLPDGGDWYDVIPLRDGRTALVVGDVMGRGVGAAAVMARLRTEVRAYARRGLPPCELMTSLDGLVRDVFPDHVVTGIFAVFDPADRSLRFVNAGHVPALVTRGDGSCAVLAMEAHPPLGMGVTYDQVHDVDLQPLDGLLLYTDGLVEQRGADLDERIEALRQLIAGVDLPVGEMPEHLARTMLPQGPDDDVAILLVRVRQ